MKKEIILSFMLCIFGMMPWMKANAQWRGTEYRVSTAAEFIKALGDERRIILEADINLSDVLDNEAFRKSVLQESSPKVSATSEGDGYELHITGVRNLQIEGNADGSYGNPLRSIVTNPRYSYVLNFKDCEYVYISQLSIGHTEGGYCTGGVINAELCEGMTISRCDLYGCGTEGLTLTSVGNFTCENTVIHDCTYYIMTIVGGKNINFFDCTFVDNKEFDQVNVREAIGVMFEKCRFLRNQGQLFSCNYCVIDLRDCYILHPQDQWGNVELGAASRGNEWVNDGPTYATGIATNLGTPLSLYNYFKGKFRGWEAQLAFVSNGNVLEGEIMLKEKDGSFEILPVIGYTNVHGGDGYNKFYVYDPNDYSSVRIEFQTPLGLGESVSELKCIDDEMQATYTLKKCKDTPRYALDRVPDAYCSPFTRNMVQPFAPEPDDQVGIFQCNIDGRNHTTVNISRDGDKYGYYYVEIDKTENGRQLLLNGKGFMLDNYLYLKIEHANKTHYFTIKVYKGFIHIFSNFYLHSTEETGLPDGVYMALPSVG